MKNTQKDKTQLAKKKTEEEEELDVDALLDELKENIIEVYRNLSSSPQELKEMEGKNPINILH